MKRYIEINKADLDKLVPTDIKCRYDDEGKPIQITWKEFAVNYYENVTKALFIIGDKDANGNYRSNSDGHEALTEKVIAHFGAKNAYTFEEVRTKIQNDYTTEIGEI